VTEKTSEELAHDQEKRAKRSEEIEYQLRANLADGNNEKSSSSDEELPTREEEEKRRKADEEKRKGKKFDDYDYSSGVESDNDVDLLVEQEVLHAIKLKKEMQAREEEELRKKGELPSTDEQI
jgi:hypothetical protein